MAHLVETMAYAGQVPWHGLGVPVSNDLTPLQMQQKAGLDWRVDEIDCYIKTRNGEVKTGQKALVRSTDDRILTTVGENWNPVQNSEAFEFFSEYVLAGDMEMHTAGSLRDGQMVWALAKVKIHLSYLKAIKSIRTCCSQILTSTVSQLTFALHQFALYVTTH